MENKLKKTEKYLVFIFSYFLYKIYLYIFSSYSYTVEYVVENVVDDVVAMLSEGLLMMLLMMLLQTQFIQYFQIVIRKN